MTRTPIRAKVAAALSVPLLALLVLSAVEVRQAARDAARVRTETAFARAAVGPTGMITRLQDERTWATVELVGMQSQLKVVGGGYGPTRRASDEAIRAFRADIEAKGGDIAATYRRALDDLAELAEIRRDIDASTTPRTLDANKSFDTEIYDRYSRLVHGILDANAGFSLRVGDADLRQGTELAEIASQQVELEADVGRQAVIAATLTPRGIDTPAEIEAVSGRLAQFDHRDEEIRNATGRYADLVRRHYPGDFVEVLRTEVSTALRTGRLRDLDAFLDAINYPPEQRYEGLRDTLSGAVVERADRLSADARARQRWFVAVAVATFAAAASMAWWVSGSITGPLESLTRQAKDLAGRRLPAAVLGILQTPTGDDVHVPPIEPVTVRTQDEVADVARTLTSVQTAALDLAVEQAVLRRNLADTFLNLGRRNQNLLSRQLDFITRLEARETDPDTLASLFRLDHLATRMRRNAESLLVLAGIDPPRSWGAARPLVDVIRGALGEVEDYHRVRVERIEAALVSAAAVTDLGHVLAELIENALTFSPPDQSVEVRGWSRPPGYALAVIDWGLGMAADELDRANRRLAGAESFTVAPSKYLGHYVAGALAARHGIRIQLSPSPPRGIVAGVDLPADIVAGPQATSSSMPNVEA